MEKLTKKLGRPTDNPKPYKITVRIDEESKREVIDTCFRLKAILRII